MSQQNLSSPAAPGAVRSSARLRTAVCCGIAVAGAWFLAGAGLQSESPVEVGLREIGPSDFVVTVERNGVVEPMKSTEVRSACYWSTNILSIVPEGTMVKKGDVVCVLDAADVEEYARTRELVLLKYRNRLEAARHDRSMLASDNERRLSAARFKHQKAQHSLDEYVEAAYPQQVEELEQNLAVLSDSTMSIVEETEHLEKLWAMGMVNHRAMDRQTAEYMEAEEKYRRKEAQLNLLTKFQHPRKAVELGHSRTQSLRNVNRTQLTNSLAETRAQLSILSYERTIRIYEGYYKRALDSIKACIIKAPCDGQVVYGNSWYLMSRGITYIAEGKRVKRRQKIFEIPDLNRLKVSVPLSESLIYKVALDMPVEVTIAGYEDEVIAGRIHSIPRYPRSRSSYTPDLKDYWLEIELLPTDDQRDFINVKSDATVRIEVERNEDVIQIPRDTVTGVAGQNFVYVFENHELVPRQLSLGQANESFVCVEDGLRPGEQLVTSMTPQHKEALDKELLEALQAE